MSSIKDFDNCDYTFIDCPLSRTDLWGDKPEGYPVEQVWTIVENHDGDIVAFVLAGLHSMDVIGYAVSKEKWTDANEKMVWARAEPDCV